MQLDAMRLISWWNDTIFKSQNYEILLYRKYIFYKYRRNNHELIKRVKGGDGTRLPHFDISETNVDIFINFCTLVYGTNKRLYTSPQVIMLISYEIMRKVFFSYTWVTPPSPVLHVDVIGNSL